MGGKDRHGHAEILNKVPVFPMDDMLELLRCPVTGQTLRNATPAERNLFASELESVLIREDRQIAYPVEAGIPILLPSSGISLKQEPSLQ